MDQITDYKQAKNIAETLELHKDITVEVTTVSTFRKYLRDFSYDKEFVTKAVKDGIKVTRLK